jgi:hypothetical protein
MGIDTSKDRMERRCPRLGGQVTFHYCRTGGDNDSACWKIFDCWWEHFDVVSYLQACLSETEFQALVAKKPQAKIVSLVALIEQARQRSR